jgi:hypothetical protein
MTNLVTLQEYKEQQGLSSTKEDVRIESLITSISQLVKTYCGTRIIDHHSTNKVETFTVRENTQTIQLSETPVVSIVSVEEKVNFTSSYTTLSAENGDYFLDESTDLLHRLYGGRPTRWANGPGAVKVTYTAGYQYTPEDLKLAVFDLITYYLKDEHKQRRTLSGATMENQGTTSQSGNVSFPDHIKRVLDMYKVI